MAVTPVSRRDVLKGTLAATTAGLLTSCAPSGSSPNTQPGTRTERRRVVVIGTGFGGAITALRLAERGVNVTLIERGRRWASGQPGTFPTMFSPERRVSWLSFENTAVGNYVPSLPWQPYTGLLERINGDGMDIVCALAERNIDQIIRHDVDTVFSPSARSTPLAQFSPLARRPDGGTI